ncbi:PREDICTED: uncharacterized protein LOC104610766 [Nelumbo nucifera]|uniref:Uncharacterized protein LOC104610766 n=1 Tax=Nelumbo nucifera TaxID=4432 RepID=A0A1U8BGX8_NELNU|nr:PREDICTED: uncharacterized protein LOC104610766 [Nelumbo nucifera]
MQVWQKKNKSLKDYLARFNKEALQVRNLNQSMAVTAIQHGLAPFNFSIFKNPPQTLAALMSHAQKYNNAEEVQTQLQDEEEGPDKRRRESQKDQTDTIRVLMQIHDRNYILWHEKMKTQSNKRNHDKYCDFYRDQGHDTENCFDLRNHIEDRIKRGYLGGFIKSEKSAQEEKHTEDARPSPRTPPTGVIHVISGGVAAGVESSSGRKKYVRLCKIDNRGNKKKRDNVHRR